MKYALLVLTLVASATAHATECRYGSSVHGPNRGGGHVDGTFELETFYNKVPSTLTVDSAWGRSYTIEIRYFNSRKEVDSASAPTDPNTDLILTLSSGDENSSTEADGPLESVANLTLGGKDGQEEHRFFVGCDFRPKNP